ncbi:MAG: FAD-dependent oxidoreductase [Gammaproteobacteria bacterium]|nr:FAD-dependent oxidoreductase [Gammaproteobacteria bacterium]
MRDQRPISDIEADVLVVGGEQPASPPQQRRRGKGVSVVLLERYGFCGEAQSRVSQGPSAACISLRESDNARPKPLVGGFAAEFVARLEERGGITQPIRYGKTFTRTHDPLVWREVGDSFVEHPNIQVVYHALVTEVLTEGASGSPAWWPTLSKASCKSERD